MGALTRNANHPLTLVAASYHSVFGFNTLFAERILRMSNRRSAGLYLQLSLVASPFPAQNWRVVENRFDAYSYRNAVIGSTRAARRAGINVATMDDATRTNTAAPSTTES